MASSSVGLFSLPSDKAGDRSHCGNAVRISLIEIAGAASCFSQSYNSCAGIL